ncbi:MAG: SDR family NAD(P)-dependent oxidoreductase [Candidatus Dormibacteria bacterium]
MRRGAQLLDRALETSVVGSFSRIGYLARRRTQAFEPLSARRLDGQTVAITGATSGLGTWAARRLGALGAHVLLLVRDTVRGEAIAVQIRGRYGATVDVVEADLSDLASVRRAAAAVATLAPRLHALIHNAGSLLPSYTRTADGIETTLATHLIGPYLLTRLLLPQLEAAPGPRVIVVTSGGMYTQPLDVDHLQMTASTFRGAAAYARAKRAQVSLVAHCAPALERRGVSLVAMHPGWAYTPGMAASLPTFHRLTAPILRTVGEGADTMVWLATADPETLAHGPLWLDRRPRPIHRLHRTAASDTEAERLRLVELCDRLSGEPPLGGTGPA